MGKLVGNYRFQEKFTAPDTTTKTFVGYPIPRGHIAILTHMSGTDYTTNAKKIIIGIRDAGGNDIYLDIEEGTAQNKHYGVALDGQVLLLETERPIAIIETPATSDVLYAAFHGGLYKQGE